MVKSGGFIVGNALALQLPEATAAGAFRVLRESGLMTSGARGVNAPEMTDLDAARFLIAMLVNERPAYAESSVRDFGQLVWTDFVAVDEVHQLSSLSDDEREMMKRVSAEFNLKARGLADRHSFEQAVAELIRMYGDDRSEEYWTRSQLDFGEGGRHEPHTVIEVTPGSLSAKITMQGSVYYYSDRLVDPNSWGEGDTPNEIAADLDAEEAHALKMSRYSTAINSVRSVDTRQIVALAAVLRSNSPS